MERLGLTKPELPARRARKIAPIPEPLVAEEPAAEELELPEPEALGGYHELTWSDEDWQRHQDAEAAIEAAKGALSAVEAERDGVGAEAAAVEARLAEFDAQRAAKAEERRAALEALDVGAADDAVRRIATLDAVLEAGKAKLDTLTGRLEGELAERLRAAEAALADAEEGAARLSEEIGNYFPHHFVDDVVAWRAGAAAKLARHEGTTAVELAAVIAQLPDVVARESVSDRLGFIEQWEMVKTPAPVPEFVVMTWAGLTDQEWAELGRRVQEHFTTERNRRAAAAWASAEAGHSAAIQADSAAFHAARGTFNRGGM